MAFMEGGLHTHHSQHHITTRKSIEETVKQRQNLYMLGNENFQNMILCITEYTDSSKNKPVKQG